MSSRSDRPSVAILGTRGYPSYYGGFETAVRHLAPYLADDGWDVTVYCRSGEFAIDDPARDSRVKSQVTWGLRRKALSTLSFGFTSAMSVVRQRPQVVLVMNVANGLWLPILALFRIPVVVNVDGIEWERAKWGRLARTVFRLGAWLTAKSGAHLVFDAEAIADYWGKRYSREGTYIPYGGDSPVAPLPTAPGTTRGGYVLIVARLVPENTVVEFFEAAEAIADDWPVVIVGSSGYHSELDVAARDLADRKSSVTWLGHVSDDDFLHALWANAGLYFHGHSVGGTNPALVQAMACGAPVLARDTVYNREVLGDAGEYVQPESGGIVNAISSLMRDSARRATMSNLAKQRAHESYTWASVVSAYGELLTRAARR